VCTPYLQSGILRKVQDAVVFTYPVYAVHTDDLDDAVLKDAFLGLDATIAQYQFDGMII
jgi:hypothetical protein